MDRSIWNPVFKKKASESEKVTKEKSRKEERK